MSDSPIWANVIRQRREALGFTKAEVARGAKIKEFSYARYESGEREPPLSVARAIAEVLDLSLAELAGQVPSGLDPSSRAGSLSVVGNVVQARRHELGLTQTRVASATGVPLDLYQSYESGEADLPLATAAILADVLDISLPVLAGTEPPSIDFNGRWWATWQAGPRHRSDSAVPTHTPLVLAADGLKLSKQNGAVALDLVDPVATLRAAAAVLGLPDVTAATPREWLAAAVPAWAARWVA